MKIKGTKQITRRKARARAIGKTLSKRAIYILQILLALVTGFLAYEGVRYSYFSPSDYEKDVFLMRDPAAAHVGVFVLGVLALAAVCRLLDKAPAYQEKICRGVLIFACIWIGVTGYLYIREHPYYPVGDQINTTAGAYYARSGNFKMFQKGGYIGLFEQQKGFLFLYEIYFALFGDLNYSMTSRFHLAFFIITLLAGHGFLKIVAKKPFYRILYSVMMMFCIPYILYLPYVYGDLPSICFSMVLFWALAAYEQRRKRRYLLAAAAAGALALMVRMNIWIVLIAVGIGMILLALKRCSLRPILAGLCIVLAAAGTMRAISIMYEYRSGYESGIGIPAVLWVAMGLQETRGLPGIYNRYQQGVFEQNDFDREASAEIGKQYIRERLREMWQNPAYARNFFLEKVKLQWLEPLFGSLEETAEFGELKEEPEWIHDLYYGKTHDNVWKAANYYQSMIYLACFCFAAASLFRRWNALSGNCAGWIPLISVVGGFLFCILWESKCRYMMPYYLYLILYAPIGFGIAADGINGMIDRILSKVKARTVKEHTDAAA
ncbi:MAG: hypothetical protein NC305_19085 [Lachnospiraceae bacterium]|nr:hypothetical protein [Lachnospiraceae bacterium]